MNYKVSTTEAFEKQARKLIKKYPSLKVELSDLIYSLIQSPNQGVALGQNCYKVRLSVKSKGKGKSGGARVITTLFVSEKTVYLISIYDKSEKENITEKELKTLISAI